MIKADLKFYDEYATYIRSCSEMMLFSFISACNINNFGIINWILTNSDLSHLPNLLVFTFYIFTILTIPFKIQNC